MPDPLASFARPVAAWFEQTLGTPTPPQAEGWPAIQRGENTLILAPTGSGKTLAAFLWGINRIYQEVAQEHVEVPVDREVPTRRGSRLPASGVRLLYISPLKALNNDIERNLRAPLEGIRSTAARMGEDWPHLRVAVRTGDTPGPARAQMVKRPPQILITTPESLFLILTSARARDMLRTVHTVIVDEIHTLCGNKRGVHLSLTLERLEHLATGAHGHLQRIGLSATQRPLEEVARFLGGQNRQADGPLEEETILSPRPVTIVDTGYQKPLDLQIVTVVDDFNSLPGNTIWPAVIARLLADIRRHRSTLIFANNRRLAERTADRLNAQLAAEETEEIEPGSTEALAPGGIVRDRGMFALGASGPIRAHHGSMSKEARRQMEEDLKAGRLPALVGTSSLELGIDIGTVDLVAQLQSPKSVAQGLQRVGRSGHLVGQTSTGRIYATFREDLVESAAIARGMLEGAIEATYTPQNALDVLAQQIIALVAVEDWSVPELYGLVRQSYAYRNLPRRAFDTVLEMLAGTYYSEAGGSEPAAGTEPAPASLRPPSALRARISWDRVNGRLAALPGSRLLAISNAGTIPDTGAYGIYLADGQTRVGELDEEFVFETRPGDAFLFGSQVWRVLEISDDRLLVSPAPGVVPRMPFWKGDYPWRPYELGIRIGRFRGEIAQEVQDLLEAQEAAAPEAESGAAASDFRTAALEMRLRSQYALDANSARNLVAHVRSQVQALGVMSSDRTIVAEYFQDAVGEMRLVLHSPFGGRVNGAWAIAARSALREKLGSEPELMVNDDGLIFRFPQTAGPPPIDVIVGMTPAEARERILRELPNSAFFGAQFRMAAGRALLLPRARGQRRTPFWLQRLKAKDLLATVRRFGDFPLVAEAYRACLQDVLDLTHLEEVLDALQHGLIRVVPIESAVPSPIARELLLYFMNTYIYEWDAPKAERDLQMLALRRETLNDLLAEREDLSDLLRPDIVTEVVNELQHRAPGYQARSAEELAVFLQELGDRTPAETAEMCLRQSPETGEVPGPRDWPSQLAAAGRIVGLASPGSPPRWVPAELADAYQAVLLAKPGGLPAPEADAVLRRFLRHSGPVNALQIRERYSFPPAWLAETLDGLLAAQELAKGYFTYEAPGGQEPSPTVQAPAVQYCAVEILDQIQRRTLAQLRREVQAVPLSAYAAFLVRWQHVAPGSQLEGAEGLKQVLGQLRGLALPGSLWETAILPARLDAYSSADLAALCASGELVWSGSGSDPRRLRVRLHFRGEGGLFQGASETERLSREARTVYEYLKSEGASFLADLQLGLRLRRDVLGSALVELVLAGLATNDNLSALRAVLEAGGGTAEPASNSEPRSMGTREVMSALESDLAKRMAGRPRAMSHTRYREAKRRARRLASGGTEFSGRPAVGSAQAPAVPRTGPAPDLAAGRWSLVHRAGVLGPFLRAEERAAHQVHVLLNRYGLIARDLLAHEDVPYEWGLLYAHLQRLEMRGEVRRGYFVAGLAGAQFALPEAVERLRAEVAGTDNDLAVLCAADPANLYGGEFSSGALESVTPPGEGLRFARVPSTHVVLWRGRPVLVAEDHGARLSTPAPAPIEIVARALEAYFARPGAARHHVVAQWNGAAVWASPGETLLKGLGFYRSPAGMEWWQTG